MKYLMYGREGCGYCTLAKNLMEEQALVYAYRDTDEPGVMNEMLSKNPLAETVPQIFAVIEEANIETLIGGYTEFAAYIKR